MKELIHSHRPEEWGANRAALPTYTERGRLIKVRRWRRHVDEKRAERNHDHRLCCTFGAEFILEICFQFLEFRDRVLGFYVSRGA